MTTKPLTAGLDEPVESVRIRLNFDGSAEERVDEWEWTPGHLAVLKYYNPSIYRLVKSEINRDRRQEKQKIEEEL